MYGVTSRNIPSLAGSQTVFSSPQPATPMSQLSELTGFRQIMSFSHGIIMAVTPTKLRYLTNEMRLSSSSLKRATCIYSKPSMWSNG
jgi:hypothetical protein